MSYLPTFNGIFGTMSDPVEMTGNAPATAPVPEDPPVVVADDEGAATPIPPHVREYNELVVRIKQQRARLHALAPAVTAYIASLPSKSYDFGDGKIRLASTVVRTALTRPFLHERVLVFMQRSDASRSREECEQFATALTQYIWQQRSAATSTRLNRTWSRKRKCRMEALAPMRQRPRTRGHEEQGN
jgi:hypothetical protein